MYNSLIGYKIELSFDQVDRAYIINKLKGRLNHGEKKTGSSIYLVHVSQIGS